MVFSKLFSIFSSEKDAVVGQTIINGKLYKFVNSKILPGTDITEKEFWDGFVKAANELAPENKNLLKKRDEIQLKLDEWHKNNKDKIDFEEYKKFLKEIGYLVEEKEKFQIETSNVDDEIAKIAGPQLVVPIDNARYALNAANARWGSLYDALYGTDIINEDNGKERFGGYNPKRGEEVIALGREFLDVNFKLENGSWSDVKSFAKASDNLNIQLENGSFTKLKNL